MKGDILEQIRRCSPSIRGRWEELLRREPVSSPLANPDAMAMLIPESITRILRALTMRAGRPAAARRTRVARNACDCGHNPYRAYFKAGEQALVEAVVLAQTACHVDTTNEADVTEVRRVVRMFGDAEINAFCSVCSRYRIVARCQFAGNRRTRAAAVPVS